MQVVKDIALRMLNAYVSPYVENLNPNDLQLSVLAGEPKWGFCASHQTCLVHMLTSLQVKRNSMTCG